MSVLFKKGRCEVQPKQEIKKDFMRTYHAIADLMTYEDTESTAFRLLIAVDSVLGKIIRTYICTTDIMK
ncbi:MAG TPA: hypothetical protein DEO65_14775 [Bacillus bacterium]|uniref:Uncharacterized protein n=1 Tax=Siminovitchia fordii TaxID=254759 RepID=A0ABQ4KB88_9BACI|nr:hypothetical protein [Siminovitchia fordii]GIN22992.1 hypothetical protein J1TS3_41260 [Siminovitchia fordii]HBZ11110.1 hypothetical protein [Bacillus sp. (in: firmicutes)]